MSESPITPPDPGQQSLVRLTAGHPLALARLKELMLAEARYQRMRNNAEFQDRNGPGLYWYLPRWNRNLPLGERLDASLDADIAEGGR